MASSAKQPRITCLTNDSTSIVLTNTGEKGENNRTAKQGDVKIEVKFTGYSLTKVVKWTISLWLSKNVNKNTHLKVPHLERTSSGDEYSLP